MDVNRIVLVLLCVCVLEGVWAARDLPVIKISASSPRSFGEQLGQKLKNDVQNFFSNNDHLNKKLIPFIGTRVGGSIFMEYVDAQKQIYPLYMEELEGIAAGAEVPFNHCALMMFRGELDVFLEQPVDTSGAHCSDVLVSYPPVLAFGHNEDGNVLLRKDGVIVEADLDYTASGADKIQFVAYTYPGFLPGNAFGFNSHGVAMSINDIFPVAVERKAAAKTFVCRDLLQSTDMEDLSNRARHPMSASFLSVNFGSSVQTPPGSVGQMETCLHKYDEIAVLNRDFFHANELNHLAGCDTYDDPSSEHRQARYNQMAPVRSTSDILELLGDDFDEDYPIYRDGSPPDDSATAATALFDLSNGKLLIYNENPSSGADPVLTFDMP